MYTERYFILRASHTILNSLKLRFLAFSNNQVLTSFLAVFLIVALSPNRYLAIVVQPSRYPLYRRVQPLKVYCNVNGIVMLIWPSWHAQKCVKRSNFTR
jgi:hypothetical protein